MLDHCDCAVKEGDVGNLIFRFCGLFLIIGCSSEDYDKEVGNTSSGDEIEMVIIDGNTQQSTDENLTSILRSEPKVIIDEILNSVMAPNANLEKPDGLHFEWYENGEKKQDTSYLNGQKNGVFRKWFESGQLAQRGNYQDDRYDGTFESWYENGNPKVRGNYKFGKPEGEWILYDKEGNAMPSIYYKDGVEVTRVLPPLRR